MAFLDVIKESQGVLTEVQGVVEQGIDFYTEARDAVFSAASLTGYDPNDPGGELGTYPPLSTGPIAAPAVKTQSTSGGIDKKVLIVGALMIGYLLLRK